MKIPLAVLAATSLVVCLLAPLQYFWGTLTESQYKMTLFVASLLYFLFATLSATRSTHKSPEN